MKTKHHFLYLILIGFIFIGYNTTLTAQVKKPKFSTQDYRESINPNTIWFRGTVISNLCSTTKCTEESNSIEIKIEKVIQKGRGITTPINPKTKVCITLSKAFQEDLKKRKINFSTGMKISVLAEEGLCKELGKTYYKIVSFK